MPPTAEAAPAQGTPVHNDHDFTQAEAARILGVTQPRVSDLVCGKIDLFSIDMLVNMLAKIGLQVTFTTRVRKRVAWRIDAQLQRLLMPRVAAHPS